LVVRDSTIPFGVFKFGLPNGYKNSSNLVLTSNGSGDNTSTPAVFIVAIGNVTPGPKPGNIPVPNAKLKDCGLPLAPCDLKYLTLPL
jgi:hypothetical protein